MRNSRLRSRRSLSFFVATAITLASGAPSIFADTAPELAGAREIASPPKAAALPQFASSEVSARAIPEVRLPALDHAGLLRDAETRRGQRAGAKPLEVGRVRESRVTLKDGAWLETETAGESGSVARRSWAVRVSSLGALHVRLRLQGSIPAGTRLWLRDAEGGVVQRLDGPRDFSAEWTPTVFGETARLELDALDPLQLTAAEGSTLLVDRVLHGFRALEANSAAGPCHNDVSCFPEWAATAAAVGLLTAVKDDLAFVCSGQLLNNQKSDRTPLFVTAHHCISTPEVAATTEVYWLYQSAVCGEPPPALVDVPRSPIAALISTNPATDFTLLEILGTVPRDLTWLGWTSAKIANGTPATAIHHPTGDFKRISFGVKGAGAGEACVGVTDATHVRINWEGAPTEQGSSGSAILRSNNRQFFGQLHCGPSSCDNATNDSYGSFAVSYKNVKKLLAAGGSDDSSEANDTCKKPRLLKKPGLLAERIVKLGDPDWYQVAVPAGKTIRIRLDFAHILGDIDLQAFVTCTGEPFIESLGLGDSEELAATNVGSKPATLYWHVFLADDTRNAYNLNVTFE